MNPDGEVHQEIIIVRRGGGHDEDAHHGGVWKIAFADFMTALMCFFLVMWLINAANDQTRAAVASYFNPVKLIDRNTSRKGLDDPDKGPQSADLDAQKSARDAVPDAKSAAAAEPKPPVPAAAKPPAEEGKPDNSGFHDDGKKTKATDQKLFADPYAVLAEIAGETGVLQNTSTKGDGGMQTSGPATGASGGQTYRDPFAPDFWSQQVDMPKTTARTSQSGSSERDDAEQRQAAEFQPGVVAAKVAAAEKPADGAAAKTADHTEPKPAPPATPAETHAAAVNTAAAISDELGKSFAKNDKLFQGVSITATDKGVVISMTDQLDYGMFEIGSALPRRDLVLAMEKIARALVQHPGKVTIDGHTDGRPFKSDTYDNWRLSAARAQSAYYMLVRGGLDQNRVVQIAGFADRQLKVKDNPLADANRRIEILLEPQP